MNHAKLREALRAKYGARNYRIDRNDQVYVYGSGGMPHPHIVGWWLMGDIMQAELWMGFYTDIGGAQ